MAYKGRFKGFMGTDQLKITCNHLPPFGPETNTTGRGAFGRHRPLYREEKKMKIPQADPGNLT